MRLLLLNVLMSFFCFQVRTQTVNPPSLLQPTNNATNIAVSTFLDWSAVSGNQGYIYEIDITASFNSSLKIAGATNRNSSGVTVPNLLYGQTYYWRAATKSNVDTSAWTATRSFTTRIQPTLLTPANNAVNIAARVNLDWVNIPGTTNYLYEVDTTSGFSSPLLFRSTSNSSAVDVFDLRFGQRYYWRVAAFHPLDTSAWSSIRSFTTLNTVNLVSPSNGAVRQPVSVTIDWSAVGGNNGYIYEVDTSITFNSPLQVSNNANLNTSQATLTNLRFGTKYYWRAAVKSVSDTSAWSPIREFTTTPDLSLVSPANGASNQNVALTIDWAGIIGNSGYIYQVDTNANFNSPTLISGTSGTNTSQANLSNLRFGTQYYWRAAAKTISDTSDWSSVRSFSTLSSFSLLQPSNNATNMNVLLDLDWIGVNGNAGYIYELDTSLNFNSPLLLQANSSINRSIARVSNLRFGTTYYWRAAARTASDTSDWSTIYSFTTANQVNLLTPQNGASNQNISIRLDWSGITGASGYIYELDSISTFNSPFLRTGNSSGSLSQVDVSNLLYGGNYYWRVAAFHANDTSDWSASFTFTTSNTLSLFTPSNNFIGTSIRPRLDWGSINGSSAYLYQLDTTLSFNSPILISNSTTNNISQVDAPVLRYGTRYYWRVAATTATDTSNFSAPFNFTTLNDVNLNFPTNNASGLSNSVTISWASRFYGTGYIYEVDESPLFTSPTKITGSTSGSGAISSRRATLSNLKYGQDYYWRVAVVSAIDTSGWSVIRKFSTSFLLTAAPTQLSPSNGAVDVQRRQLILDWTDDANATGYQFQLLTTNNFSATTTTFSVNSSQVLTNPLANFTTYYWRVRSTNSSGNSPWSPVWSFTTEDCETSDTLMVNSCGPTRINGTNYTTSGFYNQTLLNSRGCDSTLFLDVKINTATSSTLVQTACDSFQLNNQTYITSGMYTQVLSNAEGCDSTITLNLTINNSVTNTNTVVACDSFAWNRTGTTYFNSGVYFDTLQTVSGCDSVGILNLTITPTTNSFFTFSVCDSFPWRGQTLFSSGVYQDTIANGANCDSIITLDLTVSPTTSSTQVVDVCNEYTWNGRLLTSSGTYFDTLNNVNGCDSLLTLSLTIRDSTHHRLVVNACDSIRINGQLITQTAVYTQVLTNSQGCDSVLTLDVTVNPSYSSLVNVNACNAYFWSATNRTYTSTGVYDTTFQSISGCDSVVRLDLIITNSNGAVLQNGPILTAAQTNASYQWYICSSGGYSILNGETGRSFTAQQNGVYSVEITNGGCVDTSACISVISVGIEEWGTDAKVNIYPNPSEKWFTIDFEKPEVDRVVEVFNLKGKLIHTFTNISIEQFSFELNTAAGVYFVRIRSNEGYSYHRIVLQ